MTPKQKAKQLFDKYQDSGSKYYVEQTKKYALIAVQEILDLGVVTNEPSSKNIYTFYSEVKLEIKKM